MARRAESADAIERASKELYGLPLADFTRARDELAREVRKQGLADEAAAVKALRKPTITAWTLNLLARRRPADIERLLETGKRLRRSQEELLAGGDRTELRAASAEERELVAGLTRDAAAIAGEAGTSVTDSLAERIRATLHAAVLDEGIASELAAGKLVRETEAAGVFGAGALEAKPAGKPAASRRSESAEPAKLLERRRKLEEELTAGRAKAQEARREHARAAKAAEQAARRAAGAQGRADEARRRVEEASAHLREAERRERDAAKASERTARAVESAEKKLGALSA